VSWRAGSAAVGESTLLDPRNSVLLERHLRAAASAGSQLRGCITAVGATTPLHAAVALAIARGEIGWP
jgi:AMMECR1 domain-containing protein